MGINTILTVFATIICTFLINVIITPGIIALAHKFGWYDSTDHRKIHKGDVPRVGGIGIFLSFLISWIFVPIVATSIFKVPEIETASLLNYTPFVFGLVIIQIMGIIDDFTNMRAIYKFIGQIGAALFVALGGFVIKTFTIPIFWIDIDLGILAVPFTILWMVAISNSVNLVDGMDGLAGGISGFAALTLGISALLYGDVITAVPAFAVFGSILGFLVFNFPPAKIFMGDSGSLTLGFILGIIPLLNQQFPASTLTLITPITILCIPILDTVSAILRRIRKKIPIHHPDREHIHHKLLDMGFSTRVILLIIYSICAFVGICGILWSSVPKEFGILFIILAWLVSIGMVYILEVKHSEFVAAKKTPDETNRNEAKESPSES